MAWRSAYAIAGMHLRSWTRSRGPLLWLTLIAVWAVFDYTAAADQRAADWWGGWIGLAPVLGLLGGYDVYASLRERGELRTMLLRPTPRLSYSLGLLAAGALLVTLALSVFLVYLLAAGRVPSTAAALGAAGVVLAGAVAFVAWAQLGSVILPRDTSAVLGIIVIVLGFGSFARWLPPGRPDWIAAALGALEYVVPTTHRLSAALSGHARASFVLLALGQAAIAAVAIRYLLERRSLLARHPSS